MNLQVCTTSGEDLLLRDVSTYFVDNDMIRILFNTGRRQNYPLQNVRWYGPEDPITRAVPKRPELQCGGLSAPIVDCFCETCEQARQPFETPVKPFCPECNCDSCRVARMEQKLIEEL